GEYDFAWNMQVEDDLLRRMEQAGKGRVDIAWGGAVEHILCNFSDPAKEVDGERSSLKAPHPFLTDSSVRAALSLLVDRASIQEQIYGRLGQTTANYLNAPARFRSRATRWEFNVEKANKVLEDAGWRRGPDGIRTTPPPGVLQDFVGFLDVELPAGGSGPEPGRRVQVVRRGLPETTVDLLLDRRAVDQEAQRRPHAAVGQKRVRRLQARSLAVDLLRRIRKVAEDVLDGPAPGDVDAALACLLHPPEKVVLDLHVPGEVILTGPHHGDRLRHGV